MYVMYCEDPLYCKCLCIHFTCKAYIKTAVTVLGLHVVCRCFTGVGSSHCKVQFAKVIKSRNTLSKLKFITVFYGDQLCHKIPMSICTANVLSHMAGHDNNVKPIRIS